MTSVMTYNSLVATVARWLNRDDLSGDIPTFVALAENRISRDVRILGNRRAVNGNFTPGVPLLPKPARWRATEYFSIAEAIGSNTRKPLFIRDYTYLRSFWPDDSLTSVPDYYADWDANHWLIAATPSSALAFEVGYFERIDPLDATNQTNWLTEQAPDAMLYATLLEATPMIKADARLEIWQSRYAQAIASLNENDKARRTDGSGTGGKA